MLNTKQRAQLRAMANPLAVTLIIGKEGVTDAVERELDALLMNWSRARCSRVRC